MRGFRSFGQATGGFKSSFKSSSTHFRFTSSSSSSASSSSKHFTFGSASSNSNSARFNASAPPSSSFKTGSSSSPFFFASKSAPAFTAFAAAGGGGGGAGSQPAAASASSNIPSSSNASSAGLSSGASTGSSTTSTSGSSSSGSSATATTASSESASDGNSDKTRGSPLKTQNTIQTPYSATPSASIRSFFNVAHLLPIGNPIVKTELTIVEQFVNNIMKNGEKQKARENLSAALVLLRQLLAKHNDANPSSTLPSCPMKALEEAIELASPLVRLVNERRGAKSRITPRPLNERRQRRTAIMWILEASKARRGGSTRFPERLAAELVKVLTGDSSALSKKQLLHKTALVNRSNVILMDRKR